MLNETNFLPCLNETPKLIDDVSTAAHVAITLLNGVVSAFECLFTTAAPKQRGLKKWYWPFINQWRVVIWNDRESLKRDTHKWTVGERNCLRYNHLSKFLFHLNMRQLPGKASKETRRMKRERKQGNAEGHHRVLTIALPVLVGLFALLVAYVYTTAGKNWWTKFQPRL